MDCISGRFFLTLPSLNFLDWVGYDFRYCKGWFSDDARTVDMNMEFGLLLLS